ncbi:LPS export ABC transporter periplasmic protein LptC [Variovorax terrae]|uniref:LPS export ABC transporter periplasmic protein LptC n=1 Tax=Variovorax terrae TaxID=2923278 RepID=A0A9X2APT3_9BURK|nr:LPS export ABC transporter periplasmic protein LptC [Variovorax terrae]MCJ0765679.1 LPS export ABC transporter periplasmic protein LptC [Variovorax terrae]
MSAAQAAHGLGQALRLWRAGWERASIYLPIILMGVLALGSYWLVRTTPIFSLPGTEKPARHVPDYFMRQFSVKTFDAGGRLKSEVIGTEARHYPDTDTLEIDQPRIRSFSEDGRLTTATARRGLSNGDGSEVQLFGDAVVVREATTDKAGNLLPRFEARSEFLHAFTDTERIITHLPVVLIRGEDRFTADSMDYDNLDRLMNLHGRVKGLLVPKATK